MRFGFLKALTTVGALLAPALGTAAAYTGAGPGTSTIGSGGDYGTLAAAAVAINANPLTGGDWTFTFLDAAQTEAANVAMYTPTNGNTITFKPANGVDCTITFTQTASAGSVFNASWMFGNPTFPASFPASIASQLPVMTVVIDGNNGVTNQKLTIQNVAAQTDNLVKFVNNTDNSAVRNCILKHLYTATSNFRRTLDIDYVRDASGNEAAPDNFIVEGNNIQAPGVLGCGIITQGVGTQVAASIGISGLIIRNNTFTMQNKGITLSSTAGAEVSGNVFTVTQTSSRDAIGIQIISSTAAATNSWVFNIMNNRFACQTALNTGTQIVAGVAADLDGPSTSLRPTYNVYNNMISTKLTAAGSPSFVTNFNVGIRVAGKFVNSSLQHNSIRLINSTNAYTGINGGNSFGIGYTANDISGTQIVRNNIVYSDFPNSAVINWAKQTDATGVLTSNNNDLFANVGTVSVGRYGTGTIASPTFATAANLAAWQSATSGDANSVSVDPFAGGGSVWALATAPTDADLHWTPTSQAPPITLVGASTGTTGITTDLDGQTRFASKPTMGADEVPGFPVPVQLSGLSIE